MTLYEQLIYNWERGFYSVVRNKEGEFIIFSTKDYDGDLRRSYPQESLEEAMKYIGSDTGYSKIGLEQEVMLEGLYLVDTIHPSELMGKGFQVGDKVEIKNYMRARQIFGVIDCITDEGTFHLEGMVYENCYFKHEDLKPVLPSGSDNQTVKEILTVQKEEKKECVHRFKFFDVKPFIKTIIGETTSGMQRIYCCDNCGLVTCLDPNK